MHGSDAREQVEAVLETAKGTRMHALMMLGFMLGLRPGEIRALKWDAIDFGQGLVHVIRYARKAGDGKTKRAVPPLAQAPRRLPAALQHHREHYNGHEYVFTTEDGKQLSKDALAWRVEQVFKAAGLPSYDAYTMRHTFASIADDQGIEPRKIADMMGHANVVTFQRIYRHLLRPVITDTSDLMDGIWGSD